MRYAPNFYTAHAVLAKTTAIFPAAWKQTLPHITELFGRLPAILPQYRIVPEGEYASSPWCPDQPHFQPPAERNDRTILAAVYVPLRPGTSVSADHAVTKAQALLKYWK